MAGNEVACGIDGLESGGFAELRGQRVGLITNHTGLNRAGRATVDLLHAAPEVKLMALFSPEHGIRGALDEKITDSRDEQTGLPVYSLYGARTRPSDAQTAGLDTLVYDIQDVGTRFYTYISTLGLCMEAASAKGLRFIVLDRPNPINGVELEGPLADADSLDFIAYHTLPIRHGLTVGELAKLFQAEKRLRLELRVIAMQGWNRADFWDATNLTWTNPSPNMRSLTQALLYPGIGLLETTNVSVGRGTDTPFEIVGAPWMEGRRLAAELNDRDLPGTRFVPVRFTPHSSVHAGKACGGINVIITERKRFVPVLMGLAIAETLLKLHPQEWEAAKYGRLLVHRASLKALQSGATADDLVRSWHEDALAFRERRRPCLIYPYEERHVTRS